MTRRRPIRRVRCVLCRESTAGAAVETGPTWVAHARCWRLLEERALADPKRGLILSRLSMDDRRAALRRGLTQLALEVYR